jgi:hypothetical protein
VDINTNNIEKKTLNLVELTQIFWIATVTKLAALFLGAFIVYLAYNGYKRNASKPLLYAALGFCLITAGTIAEGILYVMFGSDLLAATATGTMVTVLGFVAIIYSIYSTK